MPATTTMAATFSRMRTCWRARRLPLGAPASRAPPAPGSLPQHGRRPVSWRALLLDLYCRRAPLSLSPFAFHPVPKRRVNSLFTGGKSSKLGGTVVRMGDDATTAESDAFLAEVLAEVSGEKARGHGRFGRKIWPYLGASGVRRGGLGGNGRGRRDGRAGAPQAQQTVRWGLEIKGGERSFSD